MRALAVFAGALLMASVCGAQSRDVAAPLKATSRIRGRVVAADSGQPLRRAMVRLAAPELREGRTAITDSDGRYEFKDLPSGRYSLTAAKSRFVRLEYGQTRPMEMGRPLELRANQTLERVNFRLPRGSVIAGRIIDEFGEPVASARVQLLQIRYLDGRPRLVPAGGSGTTWDTGEFRIWSVMPGAYLVSATLHDTPDSLDSDERSGYAPSYYPGTPNIAEAQTLAVGVGQTIADLFLSLVPTRLARVSGMAIDSDGQVVRGGVVMALQRNPASLFMPTSGEIRSDGSFALSGLAPGEYILRAAAPGSVGSETLSATVNVDGKDVAGIVLAPVKTATVTGRITFEPPGQAPPPAGIWLSVEPKNPEPREFLPGAGSSVVADDFTFELSAPPGEMLIRATPTTRSAGWVLKAVGHHHTDVTDAGMNFFSGQHVEGVEIVMTKRTQDVSGVVTNARGELVKDCTVIVFAQDRERRLGRTRYTAVGRPDQDGRYRLTTLPPGEYFAVALEYVDENRRSGDPGYLETLSTRAARFAVREGETKTLDLKLEATP
ncbi:MAG: carboxypeptidase regulatory-like domain-containing protein [Acidobacteria bacterium]|nr:carboxypeptidase regulatory-like domain-containing protein [Acidobacteriota bacterium]